MANHYGNWSKVVVPLCKILVILVVNMQRCENLVRFSSLVASPLLNISFYFWRIQICNSTQSILWTPRIMFCLNIHFKNLDYVGKALEKYNFLFPSLCLLSWFFFYAYSLRNKIKFAVQSHGLLRNIKSDLLRSADYSCLLFFTMLRWTGNNI